MTHRSIPRSDLPLRGIRVLLTRPREDVESLRANLQVLGAQVYCLPTISIRPTTDSAEVAEALGRLVEYDWIAFTSRNAVRVVFDWLQAYNRLPIPALKVAAVGPRTADELRLRGVTPCCVPAEASGQALASAMRAAGMSGASVLLPLGNLAGDDLRKALERAGASVASIRVYETAPAQPTDNVAREALLRGEMDVVALASPSAFRNLVSMQANQVGDALRGTHLVAIGPTTAAAVRAAGYGPSAIAGRHTTDGLVEAILGVYETEQR
jgi:uroporphyrinogen III methyltransferase/synthase